MLQGTLESNKLILIPNVGGAYILDKKLLSENTAYTFSLLRHEQIQLDQGYPNSLIDYTSDFYALIDELLANEGH